ncbi:MFS transporter [Kitasatospora sp. SolWspMP-SS2h]|uniref:MFS transporter n=1 Tax=Kitasatospora sp. SolWspMP-SS2h TaxID=1305729 RepID=UPI000DBA2EF8|nr:MFS transporter [Kitasatospora sp. SolWspMP-SS2h]RAJ40402.1 MFS transporter [Kitasatospora sp. SolWspMP-SS2h]
MTGHRTDAGPAAPADTALAAPADAPAAGPAAPSPERVGRGFVAGIALASLGLWAALYTPVQVLLARQLEVVSPGHKEASLALVTGIGALVALVANPLVGALSDRTASRFGRRGPWLAGGSLLGAAGLGLLAGQHTVAGLVAGWVLVQLGLSAAQAALVAVVPARVPVSQRAVVSAWVGATQPLAVLVGTAAVTGLASDAAGYLVLLVLLLAAQLPFLRSLREAPAKAAAERGPAAGGRTGPRALLRSFLISPRRHPDFALAWLTRLLIQLGNATGTLYLLYFLRDRIHYETLFPGRKAEQGLLVLVGLYSVGIVLAAFAGGVVSDRIGRRKAPVTAAGLVIAVGAGLLAAVPTWPVAIVAAALFGLGYGVYVSVDQALITEVLPDPETYGKDLGVINVAAALPHVLGPAIAALLVTHLGGYPALFGTTAVLSALGAVLVQRIRGVR